MRNIYNLGVIFRIRMPSAKDQGFTEDQIEDFKEVFQLFDTKGDGLIQVRIVGVLQIIPRGEMSLG